MSTGRSCQNIKPCHLGGCHHFFGQLPESDLTPAATAPGIVVAMAFRAGGGGIVDGMAIGAGGAMVTEATAPATCLRVVKVGIPVTRGMTLGAGTAELPDMGGRFGVAGSTIGRCACEDIVHMALGTGQADMCTSQWEGSWGA